MSETINQLQQRTYSVPVFDNLWEGYCIQEHHDLQTQKQLELCFSLRSAYFSLNIWFQVFRCVFSSISVHTFYTHLVYKGHTFQILEITPSSYCHNSSLGTGAFWLWGKFLFFDVSSVKAIFPVLLSPYVHQYCCYHC